MGTINDYNGYLGNKNLKRAGTEIGFTQEQLEEYVKCSSNIEYFTSNYMKIVNVDDGLVPFVLRDYQKRLIKTIQSNRYTIVKTSRQSGKCFFINTNVSVRNKRTGKIENLTIGELYENISRANSTKIL